jgi:hypothetical protein
MTLALLRENNGCKCGVLVRNLATAPIDFDAGILIGELNRGNFVGKFLPWGGEEICYLAYQPIVGARPSTAVLFRLIQDATAPAEAFVQAITTVQSGENAFNRPKL